MVWPIHSFIEAATGVSAWRLLRLSGEAQSAAEDVEFGTAGWSSPVARQAHNLKVVGSNPTPATIFFSSYLYIPGVYPWAGLHFGICSTHRDDKRLDVKNISSELNFAKSRSLQPIVIVWRCTGPINLWVSATKLNACPRLAAASASVRSEGSVRLCTFFICPSGLRGSRTSVVGYEPGPGVRLRSPNHGISHG